MHGGHGNSGDGNVGQEAAVTAITILDDDFLFFVNPLRFPVSHLSPPALSADFLAQKPGEFKRNVHMGRTAVRPLNKKFKSQAPSSKQAPTTNDPNVPNEERDQNLIRKRSAWGRERRSRLSQNSLFW